MKLMRVVITAVLVIALVQEGLVTRSTFQIRTQLSAAASVDKITSDRIDALERELRRSGEFHWLIDVPDDRAI